MALLKGWGKRGRDGFEEIIEGETDMFSDYTGDEKLLTKGVNGQLSLSAI
jgi:hypothetical protein